MLTALLSGANGSTIAQQPTVDASVGIMDATGQYKNPDLISPAISPVEARRMVHPVAGFPQNSPARRNAGLGSTIISPSTSMVIERNKGLLLQLPRPAATIFVADPETADFQTKSASLIYVFGKTSGQTVLYAVDAAGRVLFSGTITVTQNLSGVRGALARHLPNDAVMVEAVNGSITLSGSVLSAAHAADAVAIAGQYVDAKKGETVVNLLTVAAPAQVNLRVRVAEVDRTVLKQFGINWDAVVNTGRFAFGLVTQNPVTFADMFNRNTLSVVHKDVTSMVDALAQEGLITLLAQPNLTALSGETASFLVGGEFPVPVSSTPSTGAPTVTIEFKKFGVSLDFTPTIIDNNRINLRVRPEVSQLSTTAGVQLQGFSVPGLTVRRAETTIELGSGETFVIAGLLQRTSTNVLSKIPGAGDIPILGTLFRSSRYRRQETELAIIVTPYLVKPVGSPAAVTAPTDGLVEANDAQRIFKGEFFQTQPNTPPKDAPK